MIGTAVEAAMALAEELDYLGSGCWRKAYANADRSVCYKVTFGRDEDYMNQYEYANSIMLQSLPDVPEFVRIPDVSLHTVEGRAIVAMPFVDGAPFGYRNAFPYADKLWDWFRSAGVFDMGGDNIRTIGDIAYIVDMGFRARNVH